MVGHKIFVQAKGGSFMKPVVGKGKRNQSLPILLALLTCMKLALKSLYSMALGYTRLGKIFPMSLNIVPEGFQSVITCSKSG